MTITALTTNEANAKRFWTVSDVSREVKRLKAEGTRRPIVRDVLHETGKMFYIVGIEWANGDIEWRC